MSGRFVSWESPPLERRDGSAHWMGLLNPCARLLTLRLRRQNRKEADEPDPSRRVFCDRVQLGWVLKQSNRGKRRGKTPTLGAPCFIATAAHGIAIELPVKKSAGSIWHVET